MPSVQLATLYSYVLDRVEINSTCFTSGQIVPAINEAIRISNAFIGYYQGSATLTTSTGLGSVYTVPSGMLYPLQVQLNGVQLWKMSLDSLGHQFPTWATDTTAQYGQQQRWAPMGISKFVIHPNDSTGGRTATVVGVMEPTQLVNTFDTMQLEDPYIGMIVEYAAHRIQLKLGGRPFAASSLYIQKFWSEMKSRTQLQMDKMPKYWILEQPAIGAK